MPTYDQLVRQGWEPADEDAMVLHKDDKCIFFSDQNKKWGSDTDMHGCELLVDMGSLNHEALAIATSRMVAHGSPDRLREEGEDIYSEKRHLNGPDGVTWSQTEYGHPGLHRQYLRLKSIQRFTETWALLERAAQTGIFDGDAGVPADRPLRIASVGGGPGYELIAMKVFLQEYAGDKCGEEEHVPELVSCDLEQSWDKYAEAVGVRFEQWDINDGGLIEKCRPRAAAEGKEGMEGGGFQGIDYVIISYVMAMYMKTDESLDRLAAWLTKEGVRAVFVSSRAQNLDTLPRIEARNIEVIKVGVGVEVEVELRARELGGGRGRGVHGVCVCICAHEDHTCMSNESMPDDEVYTCHSAPIRPTTVHIVQVGSYQLVLGSMKDRIFGWRGSTGYYELLLVTLRL